MFRRFSSSGHLPIAMLFFVSGVASLILEVVWTRELRLVFGSTTLAASTILVAYMLGLGLGGLFGGWLSARVHDGIRCYGWMELAIGCYALLVPSLLSIFPEVNRAWLGALPFWPATLCRFALSLLLFLPPTLLMGATLPVVVSALVRNRAGLAGDTGLLYGLNTLGAVAGVVIATFVLFPALGLTSTSLFGAALDLGTGVLTLAVLVPARRRAPSPVIARVEEVSPVTASPAVSLLVSYALVGFSALVLEVCWTRALAMVLGSSIHAFAAMLAAFLTGIALGSLLVRGRIDSLERPLLAYAGAITALGLLSVGTMLVLPRLPDLFVLWVSRLGLTPAPLTLVHFSLAAIAMLPPTLVLGALFPLLVRVVAEDSATLGLAVGRVYFANTVGSATGAFAAGFLLIPTFGLRDTLSLAAALNLATSGALLATRASAGSPKIRAAASASLLLAVAILVLPIPWSVRGFTHGVFRNPSVRTNVGSDLLPFEGMPNDEIVFYRDGLNSTVAVARSGAELSLRINGKPDASTGADMATQILLGELPLLFGPPARTVLTIGFASGLTTGSVARHPVERIDAVDIEPAVLDASHFFDEFNGRPLDDPRVRVILDDGRNYLSATRERYDVIVSEPSNPWMTGVSNLFTRDFFRAARERLSPTGRLLQWVQLYELDAAGLESILAAVRAEFPFVYGFINKTGDGDLLVLATLEPLRRSDLPRWEDLPRPVQADLERIGNCSTSDLWSLVRLLPEDIDELVHSAPVVNSDDNMFVELRAPRMIYVATQEGNWDLLEHAEEGVLPLLSALGEPLDGDLIGRIALSYVVNRGDPQFGLALNQMALQAGPSALPSVVKLVVALTDADRATYEETLPALDHAVALDPNAFETRFLRASVRSQLGQAQEALADIDHAVALRPDDPRGHTLRWRILRSLDRVDEAGAELELVLSSPFIGAQRVLWREAGQFYLEHGSTRKAISYLDRYLQLRPDWSEGWMMLAGAYRQLGDSDAGARAERNAERAQRNRVLGLHHDALIEARWGNVREAEKLFRQALVIDPSDASTREDLRLLRSRVRDQRLAK